jgi:hypothetical protein
MFDRRTFLASAMFLAALRPAFAIPSASRPLAVIHKDPSCGCCGAWAQHLETAGFPVSLIETERLNPFKAQKGVPKDLWSCHTAEIGGYVIEGHVPAGAIDRLIAERPRATGLAVPGMPVGSPGMEVAGYDPDTYDVVLFGPQGRHTFARYRGGELIGG